MMGMGKDRERTSASPLPRIWIRAGQVVGLTFLIGPLSDLADASDSPARIAGISVALAAFVVLYFALLPPKWLLRRGEAIRARAPAPGTDRRVAARARARARLRASSSSLSQPVGFCCRAWKRAP